MKNGDHSVLVIEAKQGDLQRGFTQLAVELIALRQWLGDDEAGGRISGAVSMYQVLEDHEVSIEEDPGAPDP